MSHCSHYHFSKICKIHSRIESPHRGSKQKTYKSNYGNASNLKEIEKYISDTKGKFKSIADLKHSRGNAALNFFLSSVHFHLGQQQRYFYTHTEKIVIWDFSPFLLFRSFFHTGETHKLISAIIVFGEKNTTLLWLLSHTAHSVTLQ